MFRRIFSLVFVGFLTSLFYSCAPTELSTPEKTVETFLSVFEKQGIGAALKKTFLEPEKFSTSDEDYGTTGSVENSDRISS